MAPKKVLSVGDKINLTKKSNDESVINNYKSQIQDFEDTDKVVISMPIDKSNYVPVRIGEKLETCFYTKGGLYKCKAEVIEIFKEKKQMSVVIQFMSELEKYQRREYFRLEYVTDIRFSRIQGEGAKEEGNRDIIQNEQWEEAVLTDISGGGMRFNSKKGYADDKELYVKFSLGIARNKFECMCIATIVGFKELESMEGVYEYRVAFSDISRIDRENIVKFIFEEERRRRKRV